MTKSVTLGDGPITMTFETRYHIEPCWDYAYLAGLDERDRLDATSTRPRRTRRRSTSMARTTAKASPDVSGTPLACDDVNGLNPEPTVVDRRPPT